MSTHRPAGTGSETARSNPYPRALMICGAALIIYGIVAPAVSVVRNVTQSIDRTGQTPAATTPAATGTSVINATSTNGDSTSAAAPNRRLPGEDEAGSRVVNEQHVETHTAPRVMPKIAVAKNATEARARDEILAKYAVWKNAWRTRDIDAIMRLYSPKVQFRLVGSSFVNHEGTRSALLGLWQSTSFIVRDQVSPELSIDGRQAVLVTGQSYRVPGQLNSDQSYTHRFVWEHEDAQGGDSVHSGDALHSSVSTQKAPASQKTRQWRIVRSEYLLYQGARDLGSQIY